MKILIKKDTETFEKLNALRQEMDVVSEAARALAEKHNWQTYSRTNQRMAGGIDGISFDKKPENWKRVDDYLYYPKRNKANAELLAEIEALPWLSYDKLNEIVGFKPGFFGLTYSRHPGIIFGETFHLLEISENAEYTPLPDMEEVTFSRYRELSEQLEKEREKFSKT